VILSGDFDWETVLRVRQGIELKRVFKRAKIVVCGKYKRLLMLKILQNFGYRDVVVQDKSTNSYEDAFFLRGIKSKQLFPMVIVTSQPHMRRALHSFIKVFPEDKIYGFTTRDNLNLYSSFLPSGWMAVTINIFKDWKYNGKII